MGEHRSLLMGVVWVWVHIRRKYWALVGMCWERKARLLHLWGHGSYLISHFPNDEVKEVKEPHPSVDGFSFVWGKCFANFDAR